MDKILMTVFRINMTMYVISAEKTQKKKKKVKNKYSIIQ